MDHVGTISETVGGYRSRYIFGVHQRAPQGPTNESELPEDVLHCSICPVPRIAAWLRLARGIPLANCICLWLAVCTPAATCGLSPTTLRHVNRIPVWLCLLRPSSCQSYGCLIGFQLVFLEISCLSLVGMGKQLTN